jgi:hypothetical protein
MEERVRALISVAPPIDQETQKNCLVMCNGNAKIIENPNIKPMLSREELSDECVKKFQQCPYGHGRSGKPMSKPMSGRGQF